MNVERLLKGRLTLNASEVSKLTGRRLRTVHEWISTGALKSVMIGRSRLVLADDLREKLLSGLEYDNGNVPRTDK